MTVEKRINLLKKIFDGGRFTSGSFGEDIALLGTAIGVDIRAMSEIMDKRIENLSKGVIDLTKDDSLNALIFLLKDKKYSKKALKYLRQINIKTINIVQELWKVYEEKHLFIHPNDLLLLLAKIEGKESKAFKMLYEEKEYNRLWGDQLLNFEKLCLDLQIEEKFLKLKEDAEIKGQAETITRLNELQDYVEERIGSTIGLFDKAIEEQDLLLNKERKEGLQRQIDITQKGLDRVQANMRLFLIIMSIVFAALTGTFIGLLVHILNIIS